MDALQMLREDHRRVKELFRQFEEAENQSMKKAVADAILVELNVHSVLEEEVFYPAVRRQGNGVEMVQRAEQEHHTVENLMDELMKMDPADNAFDAKFDVLIENVKSHIDEEESQMLPHAAEVGMARLERLGQQMAERKAELLCEANGRKADRTRTSATSGTRTRRTSASGYAPRVVENSSRVYVRYAPDVSIQYPNSRLLVAQRVRAGRLHRVRRRPAARALLGAPLPSGR